MRRFILLLALLLSLVSFAQPQDVAAAGCSGDVTSLQASGATWNAAGWANCSGKLCLSTQSGTSCDYSSPFSVSRSAGVCTSGSGARYVSAYVTSGGNVVDAASIRVC